MKKFTALIIAFTLIILNASALTFANNNKISVKLDGTVISFPDVQPYLDNSNRTQVPIRFVSEALKATVKWDEETKTDVIKKENIEIKITVGQPYIIVNDKKVEMDTSARVENGRLFVPLRYVCNALDASISWDSANLTVEITSNDGNVSTASSAPILQNDISTVSIVKSEVEKAEDITKDEIEQMVNTALKQTNFSKIIKNGQTVVIKPNLVQMTISPTNELLEKHVNGITTDWRVSEAVIKQVRLLNPDGKIYVLEGSSGGRTKDIMEYYNYTSEYMPEVDGFLAMESDCGDWRDYNSPLVKKVELPNGRLHKEYYFNKLLYDADVLISIPCLKTSSGGVVVTASIKNVSLGVPPGNIYNVSPTNNTKFDMVSHEMTDGDLDNWIYDYYMCKPITFTVVDGLQGYQNGPVVMNDGKQQSNKMNMRIIIASSDAVAMDTTCSYIMGWDPSSIGYLNHFKDNGIGGTDAAHIFVDGEKVDILRKPFAIKLPELGGNPINDLTPPKFNFEVKKTADGYYITITANDDAVKAEIYSDKLIKYGIIENKAYSFLVDNTVKEIKIAVYDAFLNREEKTVDLSLVK